MRLSLRQTFAILLFASLLILAMRPVTDPDFWWHLRTGQMIVQTGAIPHIDPYSFTVAGSPWIAHEWLSEVLIFALYRLGGLGLLQLVFAGIIAGAFALTFLRCPAESRPYLAGFAVLLGALTSAPLWGVRPQMISLLLTALFLLLLDRFHRTGDRRTLLLMPAIMLVWANLHAEWILGIAVLGIALAGETLEVVVDLLRNRRKAEPAAFRRTFWLAGDLAACLAVIWINPNGFHLYVYPFQTLTSPSMQQLIQEWASPDFHQLMWLPLAAMLLGLIALGLLGRKTPSLTNLLLVLVFGYAGLTSMRHVPLFAIVAAPLLAEQAASLVQIRSEAGTGKPPFAWLGPVLVVLALLVCGVRYVLVVDQQTPAEAATFPVGAADWIAAHHPPGNLYNTYGWGGYLIWRLYPDYRVYIDGRADVYGDAFLYAYQNLHGGPADWQAELAAHHVRLVLIEPGSGLATDLENDPGWMVAYRDKLSILFTKK